MIEKQSLHADVPLTADICVYGGTAAGCVAAVSAAREGAAVVLIEPSRWLGGMLSAGIKPLQDCPLPSAVGGLTRREVFGFGEEPGEFMARIREWVLQAGVRVVFERRVRAVVKDGPRIVTLALESSAPDRWGIPRPASQATAAGEVSARMFIDASYEGDLLARAQVSFRTGRESRAEFDEEVAGVRPVTNWAPIDPHVEPGRPESGLLPLLEPDHGLPVGSSDGYTQAYNFRFYVTSEPHRREPITAPGGYDPAHYELVRRYVRHLVETERDEEALYARLRGIFPGWLNSGEYNYQRDSLVTIAPLGSSARYADGGWDARSVIWREHVDYLRGLHHFLSTSSDVPAAFRDETASLGLDRAVFPETEGWPPQLYVRVARRLRGLYTLTHRDVLNGAAVTDSIGLALFGVDVYPVRRIPRRGGADNRLGVATEGDMFIGGHLGTGTPYPVPYRAIVPRADDASNLLVPVCLSATHIAYAATRMEPVFCVLAESAAHAAILALRERTTVQDVDAGALRDRLIDAGQIVAWPAAAG